MARADVKQKETATGEVVAQAHGTTVSDLRQVVPGPGMPREARIMRSNNNLDLARHDDGRLYFAFCSAPTHFAHPACRFYVMASDEASSSSTSSGPDGRRGSSSRTASSPASAVRTGRGQTR